MDGSASGHIACRFCGRVHRAIELHRGERALCCDCGSTLARHVYGRHASAALAAAALVLLIPALQTPLVTVRKFGVDHPSYVWSSTLALWRNHMPLVSTWVALCGLIVPALEAVALIVMAAPREIGGRVSNSRFWGPFVRALQHWAIPEVQVLAILVAFVKIGALVNVEIGSGLWFYGAASALTLLAARQAEKDDLLP